MPLSRGGGRHLHVERDGARFVCRLTDGELVNRHKPSVDVLFNSVAKNVGHNAIGVILTGMGNDGAAGLKAMRDGGSSTIAQDEKTSVVWGMPGEAVKHGGAEKVLPLHSIAGELCALVARRDAAA
jgi:two-component system chemotaxis response regulator CheB